MYKIPNISTVYSIGPIYGKLIYDIMMLGVHSNVLEAGCLGGYSTSSFIQALEDGANFSFSICDINISSSVVRMVSGKGVQIFNKPSIHVINSDYDFVFIDGPLEANMTSAQKEIENILESNINSILAHDTYINHPRFKARLLRESLQSDNGYFYIDYHQKLPNDTTHYGLSFATKDRDIFGMVRGLFLRLPNNGIKIFI